MRTSSLKSLAAAALLVCAAQAGFAQTATASPAKKELVAKVLQLQQPAIENLWRQMLQQPLANVMQASAQAIRQMPEEKRQPTGKAIEAEIKKFVEDVGPMLRERAVKLAPTTVGPLLEERFSEDELKQLVGYLESPVYKKYTQMGVEMQKSLVEKLVAETRPTVDVKLRNLEQSVAKQLGLTPAAAGAKPAPSAPAKK